MLPIARRAVKFHDSVESGTPTPTRALVISRRMKKQNDWICTGCTLDGDVYAARADEKTLWVRAVSGFSAEIDASVAYRTCRRRTGVEFARDPESSMRVMRKMLETDQIRFVDGQIAFRSARVAGEPFSAPDTWMSDVLVEKARRERAERDAEAVAVKAKLEEEKKSRISPMSPNSTTSIGKWLRECKGDRPRLARLVYLKE